MRNTPPTDPAPQLGPAQDDPATQPALRPDADAGDPQTSHSLVWPPVDDDLASWEVMQFQSAGDTIVAPETPADARPEPTPAAELRPVSPPTPAPYVPPEPLDDP